MVGEVRPGSVPVLSLRAASKRYDVALALSPVMLTLHPGTVSLVTGHNGSGKSTLLRVAAGLLRPTSGTREVSGRALYLLAGHGARAVESSRSAVTTAARLSGLSRGDAGEAAAAALDAVGLAPVADRAVGTYSSGQRARVSLALALACPAAVVCLDEPTAHLDTDGATLVASTIDTIAGRGGAVLVATHDPVLLNWSVDAHLHLDGGVVRAPGHRLGRAEALPA